MVLDIGTFDARKFFATCLNGALNIKTSDLACPARVTGNTCLAFLVHPVTLLHSHQKLPFGAKADRSNDRRRTINALIIAVPSSVIGAVGIAVEQHAIEGCFRQGPLHLIKAANPSKGRFCRTSMEVLNMDQDSQQSDTWDMLLTACKMH